MDVDPVAGGAPDLVEAIRTIRVTAKGPYCKHAIKNHSKGPVL
jgi:hypothetical protein